MSRSISFYIGPYAMWADVGSLDTEFEDLWSYGGLDDEAEVEPGGPQQRAIFYAPSTTGDASRAGGRKAANGRTRELLPVSHPRLVRLFFTDGPAAGVPLPPRPRLLSQPAATR